MSALTQTICDLESALLYSLASVSRWRAFDGEPGSLWHRNLLDAEHAARDHEAQLARAKQLLDYAKERL